MNTQEINIIEALADAAINPARMQYAKTLINSSAHPSDSDEKRELHRLADAIERLQKREVA